MPGPAKRYASTVQLRLDTEQLDQFAGYCRDQGVTVSEAIRTLIAAMLDGRLSIGAERHAQRQRPAS